MTQELLVKVTEGKPSKAGHYITNFGDLYFDGKTFLMKGHDKPVSTVVDYFLIPYKPE